MKCIPVECRAAPHVDLKVTEGQGCLTPPLTSISWPRGSTAWKRWLYNTVYCCCHVKTMQVQLWDDWEYCILRSVEKKKHKPQCLQIIKIPTWSFQQPSLPESKCFSVGFVLTKRTHIYLIYTFSRAVRHAKVHKGTLVYRAHFESGKVSMTGHKL